MHELAFPVDASELKAVCNGVEYPILLDTDTFDRAGVDGDEPILPLCRGDEFVGEVLEGQWHKGWTGAWKAANPFTAILDSANDIVEFGGLSNVQNVWVEGWINGQQPIPLMHETEVTVLMEVPTNTASGANQGFGFRFYIIAEKCETDPMNQTNSLYWEIDVTNGGLLLEVTKEVDSAQTVMFNGSDYDANNARAATDPVVIWRIVIHDGHHGAASPSDDRHMHVYLRQGANRAAAEAATEYELIDSGGTEDSPYDISDLWFKTGYPAYLIRTEDDTDHFNQTTNKEAVSDYLRVDYPQFSLRYNQTVANFNKGDVEVWDGDPDGAGIQVFDEDHEFTGDCYIQNGVTRLHVDDAVNYGLKLYYYTGAAWAMPLDRLRFWSSGQSIAYPVFKRIDHISTEKTVITVKMCDSATDNDDYFITLQVTLLRGARYITIRMPEVYPIEDVRLYFNYLTGLRFGYVGNDEIGDDDANVTGTNATMTDNFLECLDNAGSAVIGALATNYVPTSDFTATDGGNLEIRDIDGVDVNNVEFLVGVIPFAKVANTFKQGGSFTADGSADTATPGVGETGTVLRLDAQNEGGHWALTAGTHLPAGRYFCYFRDYSVGADQNYDIRVYNNTDGEYRNEEGTYVTAQAQVGAWTYHGIVFDITDTDVTGGDAIWVQCVQPNAGPNTVYIDYALIVPIGDGMNWPQDIAHAALRRYSKPRRLYER